MKLSCSQWRFLLWYTVYTKFAPVAWNVLFQGLPPHLCLYNEWNKFFKSLLKCLLSLQIARTDTFSSQSALSLQIKKFQKKKQALWWMFSPRFASDILFSPQAEVQR